MRRFGDRSEAGRELAGLLRSYAHDPAVVVLGLTPGGIVVANEVAIALDVPLDGVMGRTHRPHRSGAAPIDVEGRTAILVDDGIASGATMVAAIAAVRALRPTRVVAAAPVASRESEQLIRQHAAATVLAYTPPRLYDIDLWYEDFRPVSDADVMSVLWADACRRVAISDVAVGA